MFGISKKQPKNGTRTLEKQILKSIVKRRKTDLGSFPSLTKNKGLFVKFSKNFPTGVSMEYHKTKSYLCVVTRDANESSLIE